MRRHFTRRRIGAAHMARPIFALLTYPKIPCAPDRFRSRWLAWRGRGASIMRQANSRIVLDALTNLLLVILN